MLFWSAFLLKEVDVVVIVVVVTVKTGSASARMIHKLLFAELLDVTAAR